MVKGRKFRPIDALFGGIVLIGVILIYRAEVAYSTGFLVALLSVALAAVFSIINSFHVHKTSHYVITFYEMVGACVCALIALPFLQSEFDFTPTALDWFYLFLQGDVCMMMLFSWLHR